MELARSTGGGSPKNEIAPNCYADEITIIKATDKSKQEVFGRNYDLAIELEGQVEGLQFPTKITVKGNFKKDQEGNVQDWGAAFVVNDMLWESGVLDGREKVVLDEMLAMLIVGKVPESILEGLIGRKLWKASYVYGYKEDGKAKYGTFNKLCSTFDRLKETWEASRKNNFPSDYIPKTPDNGQTSFNYGANAMPNHPNAEAFNAQP